MPAVEGVPHTLQGGLRNLQAVGVPRRPLVGLLLAGPRTPEEGPRIHRGVGSREGHHTLGQVGPHIPELEGPRTLGQVGHRSPLLVGPHSRRLGELHSLLQEGLLAGGTLVEGPQVGHRGLQGRLHNLQGPEGSLAGGQGGSLRAAVHRVRGDLEGIQPVQVDPQTLSALGHQAAGHKADQRCHRQRRLLTQG